MFQVPCADCGTLLLRKKAAHKDPFACPTCYKERCRKNRRQYKRTYRAKNPAIHNAHKRMEKANRRARDHGCVGNFTSREWFAIIAKQERKCARCNEERPLQVDHIIPISRGGCNFAFNLQALCKPCNESKKDDVPVGAQFSLWDNIALFLAPPKPKGRPKRQKEVAPLGV